MTRLLARNPLLGLSLLAVVVGLVTGLGAAIFRLLVALVHNLAFYGEFSWSYDATAFGPPSPWGPLIIAAPVLAGLVVVWLVHNFAPEARGPGVADVIHAIYYREGMIRPVVAVVKPLAAALSIGSGASVGREGPIIQIGAAFGSTFAQGLRLEPWQRITLIAAGAGAGIAATFNTPLGGVLFAVELLLPEISPRTFLPVVIATGTATYLGRLFFGPAPVFALPQDTGAAVGDVGLITLFLLALLGVLSGLAAFAFIRTLTFLELRFESWRASPYLKAAAGMALVGAIAYGLFLLDGRYHTAGVGYATIQAVLNQELTSGWFLALLFLLKLLATSLSLAAGAAGGVFAPTLFMGATLGGALGALLIPLFGIEDFTIGEFAIIGMSAVVAGTTGAALMAIVMIFEMTRDVQMLFPAILACGLAVGVRRLLLEENIYTFRLAARGAYIPKERHSNMFLVRHARQVMSTDCFVMDADLTVQDALRRLPERPDSEYIVVADRDHVVGVILIPPSLHSLRELAGHVTLRDIADRRWIIARPEQTMFEIFRRMARHDALYVLVVDPVRIPHAHDVLGVIARAQITRAVIENFGRT